MANADKILWGNALKHLGELPRATPPPGLLGRIEAGLPSAKIVSLADWRRVAAAAALVAALNVAGLLYHNNAAVSKPVANAETTLVYDFQLYD